MIENIDFYFGGKVYKVADSKIMFVYETGTDNGRPYVVALTEIFATITFYIPEDVMEKLTRRAQMFPCSFSEYLSFLVEFHDFESLAVPFMAAGVSAREAAARIGAALAEAGTKAQEARNAIRSALVALDKVSSESVPVNRKTNNWLKMHGYPMRRRGKKRR